MLLETFVGPEQNQLSLWPAGRSLSSPVLETPLKNTQ